MLLSLSQAGHGCGILLRSLLHQHGFVCHNKLQLGTDGGRHQRSARLSIVIKCFTKMLYFEICPAYKQRDGDRRIQGACETQRTTLFTRLSDDLCVQCYR